MTPTTETQLTAKDHEDAFTEVSFLLQVLANTVDDVLGNPGPLGVSAGRAMAAKLPVRLEQPTLDQAVAVLKKALDGGVDITEQVEEKTGDLGVGHCIVRSLAARQGEKPGGKLCKMYHYYLSGMLSSLLGRQVRVSEGQVGDTCELKIQTR